jgi:hypothetical protein
MSNLDEINMMSLSLATIPSEFTEIFYGKPYGNITSKSQRPKVPEYPFTEIFFKEIYGNIIVNRKY